LAKKNYGLIEEVESFRYYKVCLEYDTWRYSINDEEEKQYLVAFKIGTGIPN